MDFKTVILAMLVGIAIVGFMTGVSAYTFTATCSHPSLGTVGYNQVSGGGDDYVSCSIKKQQSSYTWNWNKDSNIYPSGSGSFYSTTLQVSAYAYNSGAVDTPKCSSCSKNTWLGEALSGKVWYGDFGAWTLCADN
ncbi:MAG: hypothetical protein COY41_04960 [Candidatus Altarchaeum sp. CG_4_10_14_0_8_um_filter_32_851]|nr:MAG: hypothetical protein COY41_04960 [Candidatus Altarchaeum sp. CG_4_10_14_0_8_um_filter_32_851]